MKPRYPIVRWVNSTGHMQFITQIGDIDVWFDPTEDGCNLYFLAVVGDISDWASLQHPGDLMFSPQDRALLSPAAEFIRNLDALRS